MFWKDIESNFYFNVLPSIGLLQAKTWINQSESCIFLKVSNGCTAVRIWTPPQWIWWEQASVCCENRQRRTGIICSGFTIENNWKFMHTHLETMALTNRPQTVRYLQQNAILRWCKHLPTCFVLQHDIPGFLFQLKKYELDICIHFANQIAFINYYFNVFITFLYIHEGFLNVFPK